MLHVRGEVKHYFDRRTRPKCLLTEELGALTEQCAYAP